MLDFKPAQSGAAASYGIIVQGDWPKKPVVSSYDVVEKGGFVWLFYGSRGVPEDVRPPIPMMPEVRLRQQPCLDPHPDMMSCQWCCIAQTLLPVLFLL